MASDVEKQERLNLINKLEEIENRESLDLAQKASINWDIEWDENSKFFHGSLKQKRRQQSVQGIMIDGMWHTESGVVKNEFLSYFKEKFAKFNPTLPSLGNHRFVKLNEIEREELQNEVSREEIKTAVWSCGSDKAPGPDGFSFRFIKKYWAILESDIVKYVQEFFNTGILPNGCNASFITLIPKVSFPTFVKDFRPISLIGVHYKIIAKILAQRLAKVVGKLVSKEQTSFIKGRQT